MNLLAIDSASSILSVAVCADDKFFIDEKEGISSHIEYVMNMVDQLVKEASITARELDGIVCMGGPGSFSGLRIGFSAAKGLSLALGVPFAPIPSLDCIALPFSDTDFVIPVIPAHKNAYFFAVYRQGKIDGSVFDEEKNRINEMFENDTFNARNIVLTGPGSNTLYQSLSVKARSRITLSFLKKGYSKELIEIAQNSKILENKNELWYFKGPEYFRNPTT